MMVSIDKAGRVVIPKDIRERLSLSEDSQLEIDTDGGTIRLTPTRPRSRRVVDVDGWPMVEPADGFTLTDADVQRWRDADQR